MTTHKPLILTTHMNYIKSLIVKFENEVKPWEITNFRGAVVSSMENCNILFHNHKEEGLRYSYPLIQYKRIRNKASIVCFGEGNDVISEFFTQSDLQLRIGDNIVDIKVEDIKAERTLVQIWEKPLIYQLNNWLPLNEENYIVYKNTEGIIERTRLLEKILLGNILSALKGLGIKIEEEIKCSMSDVSDPKIVSFKKVKLMSFNCKFSSNISLPQYMGLGKHVSVGYGILTRKFNNI